MSGSLHQHCPKQAPEHAFIRSLCRLRWVRCAAQHAVQHVVHARSVLSTIISALCKQCSLKGVAVEAAVSCPPASDHRGCGCSKCLCQQLPLTVWRHASPHQQPTTHPWRYFRQDQTNSVHLCPCCAMMAAGLQCDSRCVNVLMQDARAMS